MVATILSLRYTATMHHLRREWWRVLVLVGGAVWCISLLPSVVWISRALGSRQADIKMDAYGAIISVVILGWIVVPILVSGLDDTLDPARFAPFGLAARRLMPGLTVSSLLTLPSMFFATTLLAFASSWIPEGGGPYAVALVGALLSLATMVLSARVSVAWAARLFQSRRSREVAFVAALGGILILTPLASLLVADGLDALLEYDARPVLESLRLTPLASPIGAAGAAADGDWLGAAWRLGIAAGWVVALWFAWRANVSHQLVNPVSRGGGARARDDSMLKAARRRERMSLSRRPSPAVTAVRTRATRYWSSDPRYLAAAVSVAVFPIVFFMVVYPAFGSPLIVILGIPLLLAGTIGWGRHNDVAYDSTALWLDIVSGRLGRDLMRGRVTATLRWAVPVVLVGCAAAVGLSHRVDLAPGVVGAALGVLGTSLAVSAVTAVVIPYRAPVPGESPFAAEVGSIGAGLLAQAVSSLVAWIVAVPVVLPLLAAISGDARWGWLGLVSGTTAGFVVLWYALRLAGDIYNRKSGRLVAAVA